MEMEYQLVLSQGLGGKCRIISLYSLLKLEPLGNKKRNIKIKGRYYHTTLLAKKLRCENGTYVFVNFHPGFC